EKTVAHLWVHLEEELNRELKTIGVWINSHDQTPAETVAEIRARAAEAAVPPDAIGYRHRHERDLQ
ncbi:MAG TPA: hypothetical protein VD789_07465, partial [Thermomicrobiales bacterium]|nr:hypothetical protein [Thermomicrobiales bacterium]